MYRSLCLSLLCSACALEADPEIAFKKTPSVGDMDDQGDDDDDDQEDDTDDGAEEGPDETPNPDPEPAPDPNPSAPSCDACSWGDAELDILLDVDDCAAWVTDLRGAEVTVSDGTVSFGPLVGTAADGRLDLVYEHDHPFLDGCRWRATERLTGDVVECSMELAYSYSERAVSGTHCALPCYGRGVVWVAVP